MEGKPNQSIQSFDVVSFIVKFQRVAFNSSGGTVSGLVEAILDDGGVVKQPHMGRSLEIQATVKVYLTDYVSNGDFNFVRFNQLHINKTSA